MRIYDVFLWKVIPDTKSKIKHPKLYVIVTYKLHSLSNMQHTLIF